MADQPESGYVGDRMDVVLQAYLRGSQVECRHRASGRLDPLHFRCALLDCRRDDASSESLRQYQRISGLGAGVGKHATRIYAPGDGVAEFDLRVANAVSSNYRAFRFHHLAESTRE